MQGEIDFETSIKDRVQLLEGTSIEEIEKVAEDLPLMPGACETVKCLKDKGVDVAIISGSFDVVADKVSDKLGVDTVYTNSFTVEDGKLTGEVTGPLVSGSKLDVLKDHVDEAGITLDEVVAVGDGANDISMIESAGCGIAFNAKDSVKEIADVVVEEKDLCKVLSEICNQLTTDDAEEETVEEEVEAQEAEGDAETEEEVQEVEAAEEETAEEEAEAEDAEEDAAEEEAEAEDAEEDADEEEAPAEKPEFVLADTMEGVRKQKDEKEAEIAKVAEEREEFNKTAREQRKIRDELNASLKENLNKAIEYRNERNEINKEVEAAKKARNEANNKIKSLEWNSGKRNKVKIENEIKKIDKIIETRVLDIKKENQLVKNANDLRKQLMEIHEDESVKAEADELKLSNFPKRLRQLTKKCLNTSEKPMTSELQLTKHTKTLSKHAEMHPQNMKNLKIS